jgi:SPP1 family predicted phage head-tail adaptor
MIEAGKLDCRVEVQANTPTVDEFGQPVEGWATTATRWGSCEPMAGREYWQAQQVRTELQYRVEMRAEGLTVTTRNRLKVTTRRNAVLYLQVKSAADIRQRGERLEVICEHNPAETS